MNDRARRLLRDRLEEETRYDLEAVTTTGTHATVQGTGTIASVPEAVEVAEDVLDANPTVDYVVVREKKTT